MSETSKQLYTVQEVAAKLNLPVSWLYERTRKNLLNCRRYGKYIRFSEDDVEDIIASGATRRQIAAEGEA